MISPNLIWFISLFSSVIFILLFAAFLVMTSFKNKELSLLRNFPFEFAKYGDEHASYYKIFIYIFCAISFLPIFFILPLYGEFGSLGFLCIFITCIFALTMISNMFLFFFDARYTKTHMSVVTISMSLAFLANTLSALLGILVYREIHRTASLVLAIFSAFLAAVELALVFNPKLKDWARLETNKDDRGEIVASRGKVFILAFSEWLTILTSLLGQILFIVSLVK